MNATATQKRGILKTVIVLVVIMCVILLGFLNKLLTPRVLSVEELRVNGVILFDPPRIVKEFSLVDHQGEVFSKKKLEGKWTLMFFGFTHCPDICPTTLAKLAQASKQMDAETMEDVQVVMVSVDPARDSVEKLAEYVPFFHPDFIGVTGEFMDILSFSRNVNVVFNKVVTGDDYTVDHSGNIVLINPDGHYQGFIKPPFELSRLKSSMTSLVQM